MYFFSLSMLYLILHIEILVFALLIKNDFLKMNLLFSLGLSHQEFDEIVFFFLGNTHFKTILSSAAAVGTAGVITIAEMSREYSVASAESLMMFNQNVKKAEVALQVYEQMPIEKSLPQDFKKNFEYFREKGLSLEQALSEAKSLTDTAYAKVKQPPHIVDSLIDLDKRRLADFDKALSKQPLYSLIPEIKDLLKK